MMSTPQTLKSLALRLREKDRGSKARCRATAVLPVQGRLEPQGFLDRWRGSPVLFCLVRCNNVSHPATTCRKPLTSKRLPPEGESLMLCLIDIGRVHLQPK